MSTSIEKLKAEKKIFRLHTIMRSDGDWRLRLQAAVALAELQDARGLDHLNDALNSPEPEVRTLAGEALAGLEGSVEASAGGKDADVSAAAIRPDSFRWIVPVSIVYLLAALPAGFLGYISPVFMPNTAQSYGIYLYCLGLPIFLVCGALVALVFNQLGETRKAQLVTALPAIYLLLLPVLPFFLAMFSPLYNPPQRYIQRAVQPAELAGKWSLAAGSRPTVESYVKRTGYGAGAPWQEITLNADGSCQGRLETGWLDSEQDLLTDSPHMPADVRSNNITTCTWHERDLQNVSNKFVPGIEVDFHYPNDHTEPFWLFIFQENNQLILWAPVGRHTDFIYQDFVRTQ